ncbi:MAG: type II secretion system F family protein [Steroidobacteraceae bacterium]|jgi:type IV pilus assembly protein PilC|nr:type II secretion system F family protein [Steroidobacteraceae bacterium]
MSLYRYRAADVAGRVVRGESRADNERELEGRLARVGLELLAAEPVQNVMPWFMRRARLRGRELINFFVQLESLLRAGVPMLDALADLRDSATTPAIRQVMTDLIDRIETGSTLSEALAAQSASFDGLLVGLVRTGEVTGRLADVLGEIVRSLKWQDELAVRTSKAVRYPAFVAVVIFAVVCFLMVYLVPQLSLFLSGFGRELPLQTRVLMATSGVVAAWWPILVAAPPLGWLLLRFAIARSERLRLARDAWLLRLPLVGEVARKIVLARFANTFALMFGSGIAVLDALAHCERSAGNLAIAHALGRARTLVAQGSPVSEAFATLEIFPTFVVRMLRIGEMTGQLDASLRNVSYFFTRDVDERLDSLQSMIEPALTLVMGAVLGWVMVAVLGPVYDTITQFGS